MLLTEKWMGYALLAALLWGMSYAASGPILQSGMDPIVFYFYYALTTLLAALFLIIITGKTGLIVTQYGALDAKNQTGWFFLSLVGASLGALMTYIAIGHKNAALASLIEITYPFFVILFSWVFFKDQAINLASACGGLLIFSGVALLFLNNR